MEELKENSPNLQEDKQDLTEEEKQVEENIGENKENSEIEKLTKEKEELFNRLQRLQADFENFRKRMTKEKTEILNFANADLVTALLPVLDNFQRALSGQEKNLDKNGEYLKFLEGIQMIYRQFKDILEKEGLKEIDCLDKPFDPNFHEAIMQVEDIDKPENTVVEVLQTGYTFKDKLIRPAMVKVSK
ncbi:molecular chaperone GrpE [Anaerobranca gottschalkii DSM 13577]|uniref:Protein GrpE n=1 Tax=Anaerobranca gottschalkii DSM 13577 TaxID=1120990 RepID=A0A1H9YCJ7_9FIRM|nr:nucleotide exchange factor GrpE [Anaerobranca gottschalkii]SES66588.1 molecular chaperone GrpE [Anaerobranca gottschalkii DSM 13577]